MLYTPISVNVYTAALAGAMGGLSFQRQTDSVPLDHDHMTKVAGAFAQAFDTVYNKITPNILQTQEIITISSEYWTGPFPADSTSELVTTYIPIVTNLIASLTQSDAYVTSQGIVLPFANISVTQTRYVTKGGNDVSGDGSFANPFLTVQTAINSITNASLSRPYTVYVGPGVYADPFTIKTNVYVIGTGAGPSNYNAFPLEGVTILAPTATQVLDTSWSGAGAVAGGILNCAFSNALVANFAAIGSTAAKSLFLKDILTESAVTVTGSGSKEYLYISGMLINANQNMTLTDMNSDIGNLILDFGNKFFINHTSNAFQAFHQISGSRIQNLIVTWTALSTITSSVTVGDVSGSSLGQVVLSGAGIFYFGGTTVTYAASDANHVLGYGFEATADLIGTIGGRTIVRMAPTAARTLTISPSLSVGNRDTEIIVVNDQAGGFPIDLIFSGGFAVASGSQTYVPGGTQVRILLVRMGNAGTLTWSVLPYTQFGTSSYTNGVSAAIAADIGTNSTIKVTLTNLSGSTAIGQPVVLDADRTIGSRAGGGQFIVRSISSTGAAVPGDQSAFRWEIIGK